MSNLRQCFHKTAAANAGLKHYRKNRKYSLCQDVFKRCLLQMCQNMLQAGISLDTFALKISDQMDVTSCIFTKLR